MQHHGVRGIDSFVVVFDNVACCETKSLVEVDCILVGGLHMQVDLARAGLRRARM